MKAFDHDKPANRDEWVFAFTVSTERRREIGEKYAMVHALEAYDVFSPLEPVKAAQKWSKGIRQ